MKKIGFTKLKRNSGIELLKIIAMFLIVISHVTQTLYSKNMIFLEDYTLNLNYVSKNIQHLILVWFSTFGSQGNIIFLVSSAWFLLESKKNNKNKIFYIISDVWFISIIILILFKIINIYPISLIEVTKNVFPLTFALNWYITCYLLLYAIHPFLNKIIYGMKKKELLTYVIIMFVLYQIINYVHYGHFFTSSLIEFIVIYFEVGYLKLYFIKYNQNIVENIKIFFIAFISIPLLILITNFLGAYIPFLQDKLLHWGGNESPFILITSLSLFNIFKKINFNSKIVNFISSMTLLVYIIHENYFVRKYLRPNIWILIYKNYGYEYVVVMDLLISGLIFIVSLVIAILYKKTVQRILYKIVDLLYSWVVKKYKNIIKDIINYS